MVYFLRNLENPSAKRQKSAVRNRVYTDKTRLRGFESLNFPLVRAGGLCLCSREFGCISS
ncbi:MAG: hypothetical protein V7L23_31510 [Nostoc sp.]|uniref:hypothetical protein n=1 Tax=Nostoc sp. TaxID=1180 RepID=UPI002FF14EDC